MAANDRRTALVLIKQGCTHVSRMKLEKVTSHIQQRHLRVPTIKRKMPLHSADEMSQCHYTIMH
jgi:hypothetical protein